MSDSNNSVPAGHLPPWRVADMPEPLPFSLKNMLRTIGPGAILLAAAIGGGEWIVGPTITVRYGTSVLWVATAAICLQVIFNLEAVRYTLYSGEPILTGIMRLSPGPKLWAPTYIALSIAQLAVPALAAASASVLFTAAYRHPPVDAEGDGVARLSIASVIIVVTAFLLLCGKSIEKVLERLSWAMIVFIFVFLFGVNLFFVPFEKSVATFTGFVVPRPLPENMDLVFLALFAATAGSGGLGNLVISNWFRDKGFGMAQHVGGIGGLRADESETLASVGCVFPTTPENLSRWKTWWRYAVIDQVALWGVGCFLGMFLNVNLMVAITEPGLVLDENAAGAYQAEQLSRHLGTAFWALALLNGFWILYSTHLGNTDCLVRAVSDIMWAASRRVRQFPIGRLYAILLTALVVWGLYSIHLGTVLKLFKVLGIVANPILALAAIQIWRVNTTLLPPEVRPPLWRQIGLWLCALVYGGLTVAMIVDQLRKLSPHRGG